LDSIAVIVAVYFYYLLLLVLCENRSVKSTNKKITINIYKALWHLYKHIQKSISIKMPMSTTVYTINFGRVSFSAENPTLSRKNEHSENCSLRLLFRLENEWKNRKIKGEISKK